MSRMTEECFAQETRGASLTAEELWLLRHSVGLNPGPAPSIFAQGTQAVHYIELGRIRQGAFAKLNS